MIIIVDENVRISLTRTKHTWSQARNKCSLIGIEHTNLAFQTFDSELMWTGESARYLPWVEYLGKLVFSIELLLLCKKKRTLLGLKKCNYL